VGIQLPEDRGQARRQAAYRWVAFGLVTVLIALLAYLGYAGYVGSAQLIDPEDRSTDCRTPASAFGWSYEAINYPIASDATLDANPDRTHCATQGAAAGEALAAADGTRLAGWYIPAGNGIGPTGPTLVLAHGLGENKSHLLDWAVALHDDYNLVLFDFRGHGQSGAAPSTAGVREQSDLRAVLDWLETSKAPGAIGLLGLSAGGAPVVNLADTDQRVDAVILDSTHATLANAIQAQLEAQGYPLSVPAAWAILLGGLLRTGEDMSSVDPVQAIERYGDRPLLLIYGSRDTAIGAGAAADMLAAAAAGGTDAEIETCPDAAHEGAADTCRADYRSWLLAFLARSLP
jgi:pimeloyl-ACP methyl ester carboxylesterase